MNRRLFCPVGACVAFAFVILLVAGGLAWVTVESLGVEAAQREAAVRADRANKERLALWRLDGQILPTLGVENNRPFAHYVALHTGFPAVDSQDDTFAPWSVRLPSPLLNAELPDWMLLHFSLDATTGWASPQVIPPDLANTLCTPPLNLALVNVTQERRSQLDSLQQRFPVAAVLSALDDYERQYRDDEPFVIPYPLSDETASAKPGSPLAVHTINGGWSNSGDSFPNLDSPLGILEAGNVPQSTPAPTEPAGSQSSSPIQPTTNPIAIIPPANPQYSSADPQWSDSFWTEFFKQTQMGALPDPRLNPERVQDFALNKQSKDAPPLNGRELEYRQQLAQRVLGSRGGYETYGNALKNSSAMQQPAANAPAGPTTPPAFGALAGGGQGGFVPGDRTESNRTFAKEVQSQPAAAAEPEAVREQIPLSQDLDKKAEESAGQKRDGSAPSVTTTAMPPRVTLPVPTTKPLDGTAVDERKPLADRSTFEPGSAERHTRLAHIPESKSPTGESRRGVVFETSPCERKPAPMVRPAAVHLGPLRAVWLQAVDGGRELVLVRAARVDEQTLYQGVLLDWPRLQTELCGQVADLFSGAKLTPSEFDTDAPPEHAMTALPVVLDPGPMPPVPAACWSTLRTGLALAWTAALVAFLAVAVGGYSLVGLSERRIRFVSAVTHELRTPLTSLRLYLDLLTSGLVHDEEKKREYLSTLAAESDRLNRLIENVLDFARLEKRSMEATLIATSLEVLLETVRSTWSDRCAADGKILVVTSTLPEADSITTDPRMAAQILGNLIDNARKYSRDAADPRITVTARASGRGRVIVDVEDHGPGVPSRERGSIFRPFRRGRSADVVAGGVGLGLALARQWAETLGGRLSYHPGPDGIGSCFRLELPIKAS